MIVEDAKKIMDFLAGFLNENEGNRLNKYLSIPLANSIRSQLGEIVTKDRKAAEELEAQPETPEPEEPPKTE